MINNIFLINITAEKRRIYYNINKERGRDRAAKRKYICNYLCDTKYGNSLYVWNVGGEF